MRVPGRKASRRRLRRQSLLSPAKSSAKRLLSGDHAGDGVVKSDFVFQIGLPEAVEQLEIFFPTTFIEAFADGVGSVIRRRSTVFARTCGDDHWPDHFSRSVENQGVPKIARNGFIALAALADDGCLDRLCNAVGRLMKQNFQSDGALIARIGARNRDAQGIERGVGS